MEFVKKSLTTAKTRVGIVPLLDDRLSGPEPRRSYRVIHVSDLTHEDGFCPRAAILLQKFSRQRKPMYVSTAMRVAFDNGNALHDLVRNKWLRDDVVGQWVCSGCDWTIKFSKRPRFNCKQCHRDLWVYHEEEFTDQQTGVVGSIDFFLDLGTGKHVMCEAKSLDKDMFRNLKAPMGEHRVRTQTYLALIARSGRPEVDRIDLTHGRILYISKGFGIKDEQYHKILPFKEFIVERQDSSSGVYLGLAKLVNDYRNHGGPMPHGVCATAYDKRAKYCPVSMECFSGKFPPGKP